MSNSAARSRSKWEARWLIFDLRGEQGCRPAGNFDPLLYYIGLFPTKKPRGRER
jgi:hypothetical protein